MESSHCNSEWSHVRDVQYTEPNQGGSGLHGQKWLGPTGPDLETIRSTEGLFLAYNYQCPVGLVTFGRCVFCLVDLLKRSPVAGCFHPVSVINIAGGNSPVLWWA